jgi:hypothetical protein
MAIKSVDTMRRGCMPGAMSSALNMELTKAITGCLCLLVAISMRKLPASRVLRF